MKHHDKLPPMPAAPGSSSASQADLAEGGTEHTLPYRIDSFAKHLPVILNLAGLMLQEPGLHKLVQQVRLEVSTVISTGKIQLYI